MKPALSSPSSLRLARWGVASALLLAPLLFCISAPSAHGVAQLVTYYNFEDSVGTVVNLQSDPANPPPLQTTNITSSGANATLTAATGTLINIAPGNTQINNKALQIVAKAKDDAFVQFTVNSTGLPNLSLSFATSLAGNFGTETVAFSTNGTTFTTIATITQASASTFTQEIFNNISGTSNQAAVTFRFTFSGSGNPTGTGLLDNIQVNTVPEPATTAGGLLAVVGLCWHQRRRLLRVRELFSFSRRRTT